MTWAEFYEGRFLDPGYLRYCQDRYHVYLGVIGSHILQGDRVIELGCGLGTMTKLLSSGNKFAGYRCYDIDPRMIQLARQNLHPRPYPVLQGDARLPTMSKPDIVHSHGMLEHFSDEDIRKVIQATKDDGARWSIHYVPGEKYKTPSFGDERLMSVRQWFDICNPTRVIEFNDGYDYCLVWRF